ncbi:MAG: hypothetical protein AB8B63_07245 [Granulosicoccus sp.]
MEILQKILAHDQAPLAMMALGGFLALFAGYKVIKKGVAVAFWFALASLGWSSLMYGFKGSDFDFITAATKQISTVSSLTPEMSNDVLGVLCAKLEDITGR